MTHPGPEIDEKLLARFVPLCALGESYLRELSHHARILELAPGEALGEALAGVESILYLVEGAVCFSGGSEPDVIASALDPGARFALPGIETRGREAHAVERTRLLRIDRAKVSTLLIWAEAAPRPGSAHDGGPRQAAITALLLQSRLFERIPPSNIERVGELVEPLAVRAGEVMVRQGSSGDHYYVVESGRCEVLREYDDGSEPLRLAELGPGESFGEEALLTDSVRNATVRMLTDGSVARLTRDYFVELISAPLIQEVSHRRGEDLVATGARWVDVRLPEEFERDGLDGAINIPLNELRRRAGELPATGSYVTYCNTGRRAQAGAFLLSQRGRHVACLAEGIAHRRPATPAARAADETLSALRTALLEANAALDRALERKAEADAACEVEQRLLAPSQEEAEAQRRLAALTERAEQASEALRAAMRSKRELEQQVREVQACEASRRRTAESELERMRNDAEQRLQHEKQRLSEHYRKASERLREIDQARRAAEARFEQERARVERELAEARARMEAEAARIRAAMESARREAESRAQGIRSEYQSQEQQIRRETEQAMREERVRLEQDIASSIAAQDKARHELEQAEAERIEAERETKRLRERTDAERATQRSREAAEREAEVARLRERSAAARERLEAAQRARDEALRAREDYSRTLRENLREANPAREADLRGELASFEAALASADDALEQAQQAHASATQAQSVAEQTAAAASSRADTLRLELYEEMEAWIREEEERSREELARSEDFAQHYERMQAEKEARRRAAERATTDMLSEVETMLSGDEASLAEIMRSRMVAEEKARLVQRARREAAAQTARAREAIARHHDDGEP